MNLTAGRILIFVIVFRVANGAATRHPCIESRDLSGGHLELTVDCSAIRFAAIPLGVFPQATTRLILSHSKIEVVPANIFLHLENLRTLDLSDNRINTLHNASFHGLTKLQKLNLNKNAITTFPDHVFDDMFSLETLTIDGSSQSYVLLPVLPVKVLRTLRVLSLTLQYGSTIPAAYGQLPKLETLDFFGGNIDLLDAALQDSIHHSNISNLAFRNQGLVTIASGAFSNFSNLRSIILCCNTRLGFDKTIAALGKTDNSNVDTVVLDHVRHGVINMFDTSNFCSPFWSKIRRLSVRDNRIVAMFAKKVHCLAELREIDLSYNPLTVFVPDMNPRGYYISTNQGILPPKLCSIHTSKKIGFIGAYCKNDMSFDVRSYFPYYPTCLDLADVAANNVTSISSPATREMPKDIKPFFIPPSIQVVRVMNYNFDTGMPAGPSSVINSDNNIRHVNLSFSQTVSVIPRTILGLRRLHTLDWSHSNLVSLTPPVVDFPSLRHFNLSHNKLKTVFLQIICAGSPELENIDVSYNRLTNIVPSTFSKSQNIRHIKLGGNSLLNLNLQLSNLTRLETLSLHSNKLLRLSNKFISELDSLYRRKNFTLDIRNNPFLCSCEAVAFVRWLQTTSVDVIAKDELSCRFKRKTERLVDVSLTQLEAECRAFPILIISVTAFLCGVLILVAVVVWNRWYIMYRLIICKLAFLRRTTYSLAGDHYDAMVFYFANPTKEADSQPSKEIAQWVIQKLRPLAEDEEELRLFIADRDGTTMSKAEQFIHAYERSDMLVVCITPELLRDRYCMDSLRYALASNKPLCQFILINFGDVCKARMPKQLRHLLQPRSGVTCLAWSENETDHSEFWRKLRRALNRGSAADGCLGRTWREPPGVLRRDLELQSVFEETPSSYN